MPFAATWMDPEIIILSEVRQRQISYDILICGIKKKRQKSLFTEQKDSQTSKKTSWFQKGNVVGRDKSGVGV